MPGAQFRLLRLDDRLKVFRCTLIIERAGEGWIGEDDTVGLRGCAMFLSEAVPIGDVRVFDAVQQHVHAANAEHGVVEVEPMEQV